MSLRLVPVSLAEANAYVIALHRHNGGLSSATGASLRASGWTNAAVVKGESWNRRNTTKGNPAYADGHDTGDKFRWEIRTSSSTVVPLWPDVIDGHPTLWETA